MLILVVYLLRDVPRQSATTALTSIAALLTVVGLHWWRAHALLSIFTGTTLYVVALNLLT
jgi:branched-subunit amino acid transport protein AzlD